MPDLTLMTPEDARQVLSTIRQLRASGIMSAGFVAQILKRWPRNLGESAGKLEFFKFVEDFRPAGTLARRCDRDGTVYEPTSAAIRIGHKWNKPAGANADYYGLCWNTGSQWEFLQGTCPDLSCDEADSVIAIGSPPNATVNETYEHEITIVDVLDTPTVTGLPDGLTADIVETDPNQWTITISGIPTTEGEFTIIVSGTTEENECPIAAGFNLLINPCDVADSVIDLGEIPEATQFEEWDHEITFTDVENITITGLPTEITATIGAGTITLESTELPATSVWQVTISGTTTENGCPISVTFSLPILPCDPEGAYIQAGEGDYNAWRWRMQRNAVDCCLGTFHQSTIYGHYVEGITASGLPSWLELETINEDETGSLVRISGIAPTAEDCEIDPSAFDGGTQFFDQDKWYWDVQLTGSTLPNGCEIKTTIRIWLEHSCGDGCPDPTDYATLGASMDWWSLLPGQPIDWSEGGSNTAQAVEFSNIDTDSFQLSGAPAGASLYRDEILFPNVITVQPPPSPAQGTYFITISGKVATGTYAGCRIEFSYTLTVNP